MCSTHKDTGGKKKKKEKQGEVESTVFSQVDYLANYP